MSETLTTQLRQAFDISWALDLFAQFAPFIISVTALLIVIGLIFWGVRSIKSLLQMRAQKRELDGWDDL